MKSKMILALLAVPSLLVSQGLPNSEIGIRSGIMRLNEGGFFGGTEPVFIITIPDGFFGSGGGLHFTGFVSPQLAIEPQFGITRISSDGDTFTITAYGLQPSLFLKPDVTRAPYVFMLVKVQNQKSSGSGFSSSETMTGVGLGVGHRRVYNESVSIRYEARFLSWRGSDQKHNELALMIGVGAVIRKAAKASQ